MTRMPVPRALTRRLSGERGQILMAVVILIVLVSSSSLGFVWFMNQQQTRAGARYRTSAALYAAEAGVHRVLAALEGTAPDGSRGALWRPQGYGEELPAGPLGGRFVVGVTEQGPGMLLVTSLGEVAGATRSVRARVRLAPPVLAAALYGAGMVKISAPPTRTFIAPYTPATERPWVHLMAARTVWFQGSHVSINEPGVPYTPGPGPLDPPRGLAAVPPPAPAVSPIRVVLAPGGTLAGGDAPHPVDISQLRVLGLPLQATVRSEAARQPTVDRDFYAVSAAGSRRNAAINEAAGRSTGDARLGEKQDSLYTGAEFARIITYLAGEGKTAVLRGIIYIRGSVTLPAEGRLAIEEGALITESTLHLSPGAELSIRHSEASRALPGLIVLDQGTVTVAQRARLSVHGLVYGARAVAAGEGAVVDVVGMIFGGDPGISFRGDGATVIIRYDPAVLGTSGLLLEEDDPVIAWVTAWEEGP